MKSNALFATALATVFIAGAARVCFAVACGETITTDETLTADLNCATDPALTIGAGGSLDMNAFKVTCTGATDGIVLAADGTSVSNGSVGNCDRGILLGGNDHKITGVYIFNSSYAIYSGDSIATGIKIKDSAVAGAVVGISLAGTGNSISGVSVSANSSGVYLGKDGNKVKDVTITNSSFRGLSFEGDANKTSNVRIAATGTGFASNGANNKYSNIHSASHDDNGFELSGDGNALLASTAISEPGTNGIVLGSGLGNKVSKCATLAGARGIQLAGSDCDISKNRVFGSSQYGVVATTASNCEISKNVGLGNTTFDFDDFSLTCATGNIWSNNLGTKGQSCIE